MEVHSSTRCTLMLLKVTPPWFESYISCLTPARDMRVTACPLFETYPHDQRGNVQRPLLVDDQFQSCTCEFLVGGWLALLYQMFAKYSGIWYTKFFFLEMCRNVNLLLWSMDFYFCLPTIFFDKLTAFPRRAMNVAERRSSSTPAPRKSSKAREKRYTLW